MKQLKNAYPMLLAGCIAAGLGGCAKETEWTPSQSSVIINEEGTVTELIMEKLDKDYYSSQELQQMVNESVSAYNQEHGADRITVSEFDTEGQEARLTIDYQSAGDYLEFNGGIFYNGSMLGAEIEGYTLEETFQQVKNGSVTSKSVSSEEVKKHKEYSVLVLEGPKEFSVPTTVVYTSRNVEMINGNCGRVTTEITEDEEAVPETTSGLVLPSQKIFNGSTTQEASAGQSEETTAYAYIIYE